MGRSSKKDRENKIYLENVTNIAWQQAHGILSLNDPTSPTVGIPQSDYDYFDEKISGSRLIYIAHFIRSFARMKHPGCPLNLMKFVDEYTEALYSEFLYRCEKCGLKAIITSQPDDIPRINTFPFTQCTAFVSIADYLGLPTTTSMYKKPKDVGRYM